MITDQGSFKVHPHVQLGGHADIGDFCIIGVPPKGRESGQLVTMIGVGAVLRSHTVIYAGNRIGAHFTTGHWTLVRGLNVIGDNVSIGSHSIIYVNAPMSVLSIGRSATFSPE